MNYVLKVLKMCTKNTN